MKNADQSDEPPQDSIGGIAGLFCEMISRHLMFGLGQARRD
jgi:hypothetical protein